MNILNRTIQADINRALHISPAVLLAGARQVGKTTLVTNLNREYIVMDDITQLDSALNDPQGYIKRLHKPITLDEIQKLPQLLTPIKHYIDNNRKNGDFLLTGSANILNLKRNEETLVGRLIELTIYPFSAKEKNSKADENILDIIFESSVESLKLDKENCDLVPKFIIEGGYPISCQLSSVKDRFLWFNSYISTYIERDIRSIGDLRDIDNFIRFFNIIFPRSANILNKSDIASDARLTTHTIDNYISLLEKVYQIHLLKPYFENIGKRFVKSPKLYLTDSGILCHILAIRTEEDLENSNHYKGAIYETFVFSELLKHINYSDKLIEFYYYRTQDQKEIDFIIKSQNKILAIEVKAAHGVKKADFKHIIDFQARSSNNIIGIVFYAGNNIVSFADNLFAIPIGILL
jgi:predicted AAA+ superfamily ATPase